MPDRKQGLTIDETYAVLRQVAHFHALSLSYKFEKRKQFESLRKITNEGLFSADNESWYRNYYEILTTNAIQMVHTKSFYLLESIFLLSQSKQISFGILGVGSSATRFQVLKSIPRICQELDVLWSYGGSSERGLDINCPLSWRLLGQQLPLSLQM